MNRSKRSWLGDRAADLLLEFDGELQAGKRPKWPAYLARCSTKAKRIELVGDMLSVEVERLGWDKARVRRRLRLLEEYHCSRSRLLAVMRGLYADRLQAGEFPSARDFERLGVPMEQLRLRAATERVFLGCTVGRRFRLEQVLGNGTFGIVYRASDRRTGSSFAVKAVRGADNEARRVARRILKDEASALRTLQHPGIPRFVALVAEHGTLCLVLQYIEGGTLLDLIRQGRVSPERGARIVATVADALDFAHRKGFVHRDLKLANVLLDKEGHPYVADFGLAVLWNDGVDRDGERRGSGAYAALESSLGMGRRLDWRADVFSAGVILYELVTGKPLLSREGWEGAMVDAFTLEWRRLWFPRDVPRALRDICAKCLARDPNNRYHTAGHLHSALTSFLGGVSHGKEAIVAGR